MEGIILISPIHTSGIKLYFKARIIFLLIFELFSLKYLKRSAWPNSTILHPQDLTMDAEISPVNGPVSIWWIFWAPSKIGIFLRLFWKVVRDVKGGIIKKLQFFF